MRWKVRAGLEPDTVAFLWRQRQLPLIAGGNLLLFLYAVLQLTTPHRNSEEVLLPQDTCGLKPQDEEDGIERGMDKP